MRATIDNIALAALVFAVIAIAAVSTVAVTSAERLIAINEQVLRSQRLVSSVDAIRFHTMSLDGGEQNFVITGNERDLGPFKAGGVEIEGELEYLRGNLKENATLAAGFPALEKAAREFVASERRIVETRRTAGFAAAQALVRAHGNEGLQERLLGAASGLLTAFRNQQARQEADQIEYGDKVRRLILALISSSAFILVFLYGTLRRLSKEQRRAEAQFKHQATHDSLTGLHNRHAVMDHISTRIADRDSATALGGLALMLVDLDGFKEVNDRFGHGAGDDMLGQVARRMLKALRETDYVARLGGDEFLVVIPQVSDRETAALIGQKLIDAIGEPYQLGGASPARVSASVGISTFPRDAADREALMRCADVALYAAKNAGKSRLRFYESHMRPETP